MHRLSLSIHMLGADNCSEIASAFAAQGWNKPVAQYQRYYDEQQTSKRQVLVARLAGSFAGYLTILWQSSYLPFRSAHIPEITDFNVLIAMQRQGIGTALMDEAERLIAPVSPIAGIGVGLTSDYGPAQILYSHRGYVPDGRGIYWKDHTCVYGEQVVVDDDLALYLTKRLNS